MPIKGLNTIDEISLIFCKAVQEVLEASTGSSIRYAPTVQKIPSTSLKPDIGGFVQFFGDYNGLFIMNLSGAAAFELYQLSMRFMGMPEEELAEDHTSEEVVNFVGEMMNQIIGAARRRIEAEFGLSATNNQPMAITIAAAINLAVATMLEKSQCRRLSFKTASNHPFHVESNIEQTEFIRLAPVKEGTSGDVQTDIDALIAEGDLGTSGDKRDEAGATVDIDALMAEYSKG